MRAICEKISNFQHSDDVYSRVFLTSTVVLQAAKSTRLNLTEAKSILRECGKEIGVNLDAVKILTLRFPGRKEIPEGPYFIQGEGIFEAWKVYSDDCDTFQTTVMPDRSGSHEYVLTYKQS